MPTPILDCSNNKSNDGVPYRSPSPLRKFYLQRVLMTSINLKRLQEQRLLYRRHYFPSLEKSAGHSPHHSTLLHVGCIEDLRRVSFVGYVSYTDACDTSQLLKFDLQHLHDGHLYLVLCKKQHTVSLFGRCKPSHRHFLLVDLLALELHPKIIHRQHQQHDWSVCGFGQLPPPND